jgi:hypothetical protein
VTAGRIIETPFVYSGWMRVDPIDLSTMGMAPAPNRVRKVMAVADARDLHAAIQLARDIRNAVEEQAAIDLSVSQAQEVVRESRRAAADLLRADLRRRAELRQAEERREAEVQARWRREFPL